MRHVPVRERVWSPDKGAFVAADTVGGTTAGKTLSLAELAERLAFGRETRRGRGS